MDVAVIGAGRVGTAIAVLLRDAGHRITAVTGRDASRDRASRYLPSVPFVGSAAAAAEGGAELVLLGVPDDAIGATVLTLVGAGAIRAGQWVAHLSGASGTEILEPARAVGGRSLAIHPLQTFPDVEAAIARIPGSALAVTADEEEGFDLGERLGRDLRTVPFRLPNDRRPLYHASAVFASNYLVATVDLGRQLFALAGVPDPSSASAPLVRATIDNVERLGAERALTGPAVRGDAGTIEKNLQALSQAAPDAVAAYVALARVALDLAERGGRLSAAGRARVEEVLARWT